MREDLFLTNQEGIKLSVSIERDESKSKQGLIIMISGFGAPKDNEQYNKLSELYQSFGFAVTRLDLPGRGQSEGVAKFSTIANGVKNLSIITDYLKTLSWVDKDNIGIYGNSYGGGVAIMEAATNPVYKFMILSSPSVNNKEMYEYSNIIDIPKWEEEKLAIMFNKERHYCLYEEGINLNLFEDAKKIKIPALILHGDKDECVPLSQAHKIHDSIKNSKLVILNGHNHRYEKDFTEVLSEIKSWLEKI